MSSSSCKHLERLTPLESDGEALLRSEIEFWQGVIDSCPANQPVESIERMHQALALAQSRLEKLRAESRALYLLSSRDH